MTINPYVLNSLYNQGIIDCVPMDLCTVSPMTQSGVMETAGLSTMPQIGNIKQNITGSQIINQNTYNSTQTGSQYLDTAMKGEMYGYYGNSYDSFVRSSNNYNQQSNVSTAKNKMSRLDNGIGSEYNGANAAYGINNGVGIGIDHERMANDLDGQNLRVSIKQAAASAKESVMNSHPAVKGLLSIGIIGGTILLLLKGKKKPAVQPQTNTSFWSKLNPKNWFRKN